ncbi:hypothetical protein ACYEXS_36530 [Paenibacillus sp. MAH-36]|uniref:Uncharacterized protein n=1 Tax=Paenibacillus violae TaxID=3077234 RepID=A0ABU3RI93_9BACL|nr:hypothetical protein [Paenibacillus sp. PFR10]MDU0203993.1 hypothetical protein [Paenibacillus sp. PFR10]
MRKTFSFAFVTPMGIYVNRTFYTCARAIEEQWYLRAATSGTWLIPVIYSKDSIDSIRVIYDGEIFNANVVPDTSKISEFVRRSIRRDVS